MPPTGMRDIVHIGQRMCRTQFGKLDRSVLLESFVVVTIMVGTILDVIYYIVQMALFMEKGSTNIFR